MRGGGPGNNSISTNDEPESGPPGIGTLTATDSGDGETEENEEQQQIIVVNQEEQQQITVNVQSEPEEESEEEEEEEENNNEETPQQLTIIEEPEPTYIPPAKEEPRYSASTASLGSSTGNRFTGFPTVGGSSILDSITATYHKQYGFVGDYVYKGVSGKFSSDVKLIFTLDETNAKIRGYLGDDIQFYKGSGSRTSISNYYRFYGLLVDATVDTKTGSFTVIDPEFGFYIYDNLDSRPSRVNRTDSGTGTIKATFSNGGSNDDLPSIIKGEVTVTGFLRKNPLPNPPYGTESGSSYGSDNNNDGQLDNYTEWPSGENNSLTGTFRSDLVSDIKVRKLEGNIDMFSYGIWVNDNFLDKRIEFLTRSTKFNPERTASDYTAHTYTESYSQTAEIKYKRENGFKGAYVYEGETGELTGDVDLSILFGGYGVITVAGDVLTDLEIGGYDLKGIAILNARIDANTGVGGIDIDADGLDDSNTSAKFAFGDYIAIDGLVDRATVNHHGLARKVKVVLSPDGIQAQGSTPETYPSQIAGEIEINQFKIKDSDGDNNTILGVFVADKQE